MYMRRYSSLHALKRNCESFEFKPLTHFLGQNLTVYEFAQCVSARKKIESEIRVSANAVRGTARIGYANFQCVDLKISTGVER